MFFDDFHVGFTATTAPSAPLTEDAIIAFARDYDPQPFHTDPQAARDTIYGGLIASGVQTMGIALRQVIESGVWAEASMGSPGLDEIRWPRPTRPGDVLTTTMTVLALDPSRTRPDRGRVRFRYETRNQRDEIVMTYEATQLLLRRRGPDVAGTPEADIEN